MDAKGITDIQNYNNSQSESDKAICDFLKMEIETFLPGSESKIWHGSPVWFLEGNPIVGYHKLKASVRLLFWSGQSFEEALLTKEGSFKAAEIRYTDKSQIDTGNLHRWLKKGKRIQWNYKDIIKKRGVLEKIEQTTKTVDN